MTLDEARKFAEMIFPKITFEAVPHWSTQQAEKGYKSFSIVLGGETLGRVEHGDEHLTRQAGRLISRSWHRKRWCYSHHKIPTYGLWYTSRKSATIELIALLLRDGSLTLKKRGA